MCKIFYKWATDLKAPTFDVEVKQIINIIEERNEWLDLDKQSEVCDGEMSITDCAVKTMKGDKVVYDIFRENIHIHASVSAKEQVYSIRIRCIDEMDCGWTVLAKDGNVDYSHPTNEYFEVYVWYVVPVLDITESRGYVYKHGTWDKYVYKTLQRMWKEKKKLTIESRFNELYK